MEDSKPKSLNIQSYGRAVRLSQALIDHVSPQVKYPETFSDTLERLLKVKKLEIKNASKRTNKKN